MALHGFDDTLSFRKARSQGKEHHSLMETTPWLWSKRCKTRTSWLSWPECRNQAIHWSERMWIVKKSWFKKSNG
jgi:hypothetical protein